MMECTVCTPDILSVLDGSPEYALKQLNAAHGDQIKIRSILLRTFEGFAEQVLELEKSVATEVVMPRKLASDRILFWANFKMEHRGKGAEKHDATSLFLFLILNVHLIVTRPRGEC